MSSNLAQSLAFAGINDDTRAILRETWPRVRDSVPLILQAAYAPASGRGAASLAEAPKLAAARDAQAKHWEALFQADFDEDYAASLRQIGKTHAHVGLDPQFLIAAHQTTLARLHSLVVEAHYADLMSFGARSRLDRAIRAVDQVVMFDLLLCMASYVGEIRGAAAGQQADAWSFEAATGSRTGDRHLVTGDSRRSADTLFAAGQRRRSQAVAAEHADTIEAVTA